MATQHGPTTVLGFRIWRTNQSPFTTPAVNWPADALAAELIITTTDFIQATQQATFTIDKSIDAGITWEFVTAATFIGGVDRHGNPITPGIQFTPDSSELLVPFRVRVRLDQTGPNFTGGLDLTYWTEP